MNFQEMLGKKVRMPRLDTVLMVERFVKENSGEYKIYSLWKLLPKKVMYQIYKIIIAYLLDINKIAIDIEGKIGYIWSPDYKRDESLS